MHAGLEDQGLETQLLTIYALKWNDFYLKEKQ